MAGQEASCPYLSRAPREICGNTASLQRSLAREDSRKTLSIYLNPERFRKHLAMFAGMEKSKALSRLVLPWQVDRIDFCAARPVDTWRRHRAVLLWCV